MKKSVIRTAARLAEDSGSLVFYGFWGWRRRVIAPAIRRYLKPRIPAESFAILDAEPFDYFNGGYHAVRKLRYRLAFPRGNNYGPFGVLKLLAQALSPFIGRLSGATAREAFDRDPILFMRTAENRWVRLLGRIAFPFGELRSSAMGESDAVGTASP